jgi:hypothetical protein
VSAAGTFAFGDLGSGRFGLALLAYEGHGLAAVFSGGELAGQTTDGTQVEISETEPGRRWWVRFAGDGAGFDLEFEALTEPVPSLGGEDQLCRVSGTVTAGGAAEPIECLGQRGTGSDERPAAGTLVRWIGAWLADDDAVLARAQRDAGADLEAETLAVHVIDGEPPAPVRVADPRLSTQYDAEGRHVRAGLELWVGEDDDYARRAAGVAVCATSFEFGSARLDCAFLHWRMHGREGAGVYDLLRVA